MTNCKAEVLILKSFRICPKSPAHPPPHMESSMGRFPDLLHLTVAIQNCWRTLTSCRKWQTDNIKSVIFRRAFNFKTHKFFILVINQLDAQNLFYNKFISCLYMFRATCDHRQEVKNRIIQPLVSSWPSGAQVERGLRSQAVSKYLWHVQGDSLARGLKLLSTKIMSIY